jgi:hypothetical protein
MHTTTFEAQTTGRLGRAIGSAAVWGVLAAGCIVIFFHLASTFSMADPGRPRKQHRVSGDAAALQGHDPRIQRSSWDSYTYTDE